MRDKRAAERRNADVSDEDIYRVKASYPAFKTRASICFHSSSQIELGT